MTLSPNARKWIRAVVDYGGLVAWMAAYFLGGRNLVNATWALTRALQTHRPRLVLCLGTAGSPRHPAHTLVECTAFVQRDMDVSALGLAPGVTPFDTLPSVLTVPRRYPSLPEGTCGSGDSFVAGHPVTACDVLDMEAYAIAKVCRLEGIDHMALKYVTDGGDTDAHLHWAENLPRAAAAFRAAYDQIVAARS